MSAKAVRKNISIFVHYKNTVGHVKKRKHGIKGTVLIDFIGRK